MSGAALTTAKAAKAPPAAAARPALTPVSRPLLQRKCGCGGVPGVAAECEECRKKQALQRSASGGAAPAAVPPIVGQVLGSAGRPLDAPTRSLMELRFGHDFSRVRVHDDATAAESARAVNAKAYTVGQDIVFAAGQYSPQAPSGSHLLAHELAHTVQQSGLQRYPDKLEVAELGRDGRLEREAELAARSVLQGAPPAVALRPPVQAVQRAAWGHECPAGEVVPANNQLIYTAAEDFIVEYYLKERGKKNVSTRAAPVESLSGRGPEGDMIAAAQEDFRSGKSPRRVRTVPVDPSKLEQVGKNPVTLEPVGEVADEGPATESALLRPDVLDFRKSEVYDVTTEKQAPGKKNKVKGYADLLEKLRAGRGIGTPAWTAGITLEAPEKNRLDVEVAGKTIAICFGVTDFTKWAGVLAYSPIDIGKAAPKAAAVPEIETEPYPVKAGDNEAVFLIPKEAGKAKKVTSAPLADSPIPETVKVANNLIPGMVLQVLHRRGGKGDTIDAQVTLKRQKSIVEVETRKDAVVLRVEAGTGKLTLQRGFRPLKVRYPYLSEGTITKLEMDETGGLSGEGHLKSDLPLLRGINLGIAFGADDFRITTDFKDKVKLPFPGFKLTESSLALILYPDFKPSGTIAFELLPGGKKLIDGKLTAEADADGFVARGDLNAYLPGVDKAGGKIEYGIKRGWSGGVTVESTQIKLPYVKSGQLVVGFKGSDVFVTGGVKLGFPGDNEADVTISRGPKGEYVYVGGGTFNVPVKGIEPVKVHVLYDGEQLDASGETGFALLGLTGRIAVHYRKKKSDPEPRFSGHGTLHIKKSKAEGDLTVDMSPEYKFSGKGTVTYKFSEYLVGTAGVELFESGKVRLSGEIVVPKPILLFKAFGDKYTLLDIKKEIPIPGASLGPLLGLQAVVGVALGLDYQIGPGQLENVRLAVAFNPLEDDPDFDLTAGARLNVPAHAGVWATLKGGLALSAGIAEVSGTINATGRAALQGGAAAEAQVHYTKARHSFDAKVTVDVELVLGLSLDAEVAAEAGIGPFKVHTSKAWNLASFEYKPGIRAGLVAPFHYASDEPFKAPSLDDIQWIKPTFDPVDAIRRLFDANKGSQNPPEGGG
jgi:hypothetical protein